MKRLKWERAYESNVGRDTIWQIDDLPSQVETLLESPDIIRGSAVDLGCGTGGLTIQLTRYFPFVVGADFALSAVRQAVAAADGRNAAPHFLVSDATQLPFGDGRFDFVFDRGCLQGIPFDRWPAYFSGVERIMKQGAYYQVFCRFGQAPGRPLRLALERLKPKVRRSIASDPRSPARLPGHLPSTFECETVESQPFVLRSGSRVDITHIICRKT